MEVYGEISSPIESAGRLIWAGSLRGAGIGQRGEFTFVLEREGSIEIYVLLVVLFRLVFAELSLDMAWQRCWQQAVRQCGEGNVKVFNLNQRLGASTLSCKAAARSNASNGLRTGFKTWPTPAMGLNELQRKARTRHRVLRVTDSVC
jgi:hypothetical protein